jgi:hypothetical protein
MRSSHESFPPLAYLDETVVGPSEGGLMQVLGQAAVVASERCCALARCSSSAMRGTVQFDLQLGSLEEPSCPAWRNC